MVEFLFLTARWHITDVIIMSSIATLSLENRCHAHLPISIGKIEVDLFKTDVAGVLRKERLFMF
jgi:hypothetical protein